MNDCIDREIAKEAIRKRFRDMRIRCEVNAVLNEIPAADVVEVVRCDDCRYFKGFGLYCEKDILAIENGYCSYGEEIET